MDKQRRRSPQSRHGGLVDQSQNKPTGKKRFIADDFQDNEPTQSLWVGNGNESFFSSGGTRKEKGDLVTILVYKKLKEDIQNELERAFPKTGKEEKDKDVAGTQAAPAKESSPSKQLFDKISSTVTKEIKNNHIVLSGRKHIMFNDYKHLVEIKALVNRKDVTVDDTIESQKILQSSIKVLR